MSDQGIKHKILLVLITLTIIGEILSILIWTFLPEQRFTILSYELAVISAGFMVLLNALALYWIIKGSNWAPLYFIAISIGNSLGLKPTLKAVFI